MIDFRSSENPTPPDFNECDVVLDWCEFSGETVESVRAKADQYKKLNAEAYHRLGKDFYNEADTYIYDILTGNAAVAGRVNLINRFIPNAFGRIIDHPGKSFADFGAGIGIVCEIVKRAAPEKQVTFIDLESKLLDFALWRNVKYLLGIDLEVIPKDDFTLSQSYDIIFTDAVWEHLPPEKQGPYLEKLASYVNHNGLLYFLVDLSGPTEDMPMHFPVDIRTLHDSLVRMGFQCLAGQYNFASVWQKTFAVSVF